MNGNESSNEDLEEDSSSSTATIGVDSRFAARECDLARRVPGCRYRILGAEPFRKHVFLSCEQRRRGV